MSSEKPFIPFKQILNEVNKLNLEMGGLFPVEIIPTLAPRSNENEKIFLEGADFSGIERNENAEACITPTISPHIQPTLPISKFLEAAESVIPHSILPQSLENVELISPQLIVWWRQHLEGNSDTPDTDMIGLADHPKRKNFNNIIEFQVEKSVAVIAKCSDNMMPTIWGSWGNASTDVISQTGRSRGVPTVKQGHIHVTAFPENISSEMIKRNNIPATSKLTHLKPIGSFFHSNFSKPFTRYFKTQLNKNLENPTAEVTPFSENITDTHGQILIVNNGYRVIFNEPLRFKTAFNNLIDIAKDLETLQKEVTGYIKLHYMNLSDSEKPDIFRNNLQSGVSLLGFTEDEAILFSSFIAALHPTYGQLNLWKSEMNTIHYKKRDIEAIEAHIERYAKLREKIGSRNRDSIATAIVSDILAEPEKLTARNVWSEHASATYIIPNYKICNGHIMIHEMKILPGIDSTESAPEFITGRIINRP